MKQLSEEKIQTAIKRFYASIQNDENARFKSWEHCFKVFEENKNKTDQQTIDFLCLNLAFYLASWGMYRGSSFLLQKDYKVHTEAVIEMQKSKYNILRNATPDILVSDNALLVLFELQGELNNIYTKIKKTVSNSKTGISDTLITKILLGVFGSVPAYDRYVKYTLKEYNLGTPSFTNPMKIKEIYNLYNSYKNIIDKERDEINSHGIEYPYMKIIDIFLWQIGFDDDVEGKLKKDEEDV